MQDDLKKLRTNIDNIDIEIVKLINKRANLALEIGKIKTSKGRDIFVPSREKEVVANVKKANKGPVLDISLEAIYTEIMSACRGLEEMVNVAYLGPEATFTHQAAMKVFGTTVNYLRMVCN